MEKKKIFDDELKEQFVAISNYCRGVGHNLLGKDRMQTKEIEALNINVHQTKIRMTNKQSEDVLAASILKQYYS